MSSRKRKMPKLDFSKCKKKKENKEDVFTTIECDDTEPLTDYGSESEDERLHVYECPYNEYEFKVFWEAIHLLDIINEDPCITLMNLKNYMILI